MGCGASSQATDEEVSAPPGRSSDAVATPAVPDAPSADGTKDDMFSGPTTDIDADGTDALGVADATRPRTKSYRESRVSFENLPDVPDNLFDVDPEDPQYAVTTPSNFTGQGLPMEPPQ